MTLNDPKARFQGHVIICRWISQKGLKETAKDAVIVAIEGE